MEYWHDMQTEKSWEILKSLKGRFDFILIGGWAVYLWSRGHKSKDIDIIVDFETLSGLKKNYDLRKNDILKKYEIKTGEIDIDVYVRHFSKLAVPPEEIKSTKIEGFDVAEIEYLLALKLGAEMQRSESEKGEKDRIDIMDILLRCDIDFGKFLSIIKEKKISRRLVSVAKGFKEPSYFGMNPRQFKLEKNRILENLRKAGIV